MVTVSEPWHMIFKFMIREGSLSQESKTAVHWLLLVGKGTASTKIVVPC